MPGRRVAICAFLAWLLAVPPSTFAQQQGDALYAAVANSVFAVSIANDRGVEIGTASGFVVAPDLLLTNAHVANAGHISVHVGPIVEGCDVRRIDRVNDLALCQMRARGSAKPLKFAAEDPKPGATIFAVGNPLGPNAVSEGRFNGYRSLSGRRVAEISAPISPGSSGGPIVNADGDVVGVAVGSLSYNDNRNFAVPRDVVREFMDGSRPAADVHSGVVSTLVGVAIACLSVWYGGHKAGNSHP